MDVENVSAVPLGGVPGVAKVNEDTQAAIREVFGDEAVPEVIIEPPTATNGGNVEDTIEGPQSTAANSLSAEPARYPKPVHYIVTRWDQDPFSLGSYSFWKKGAPWRQADLVKPEEMGTGRPIVFFGGEHTDPQGWQCVDGAFYSGLAAAHGILKAAGLASPDSHPTDLTDLTFSRGKKRHVADAVRSGKRSESSPRNSQAAAELASGGTGAVLPRSTPGPSAKQDSTRSGISVKLRLRIRKPRRSKADKDVFGGEHSSSGR